MTKEVKNKIAAKPFVKWAGGKGSLISQLVESLPHDFAVQQNITYIEPFVGGGAGLGLVMVCRASPHTFKIVCTFSTDLFSSMIFMPM